MNPLKSEKLISLTIMFLTSVFLTANVVNATSSSKITNINTANTHKVALTDKVRRASEGNKESQSSIKLSSEEYIISELYNCIFRVEPKTSIDKFKQKFNIEAEKVHVYKDISLQEEITSGNVGTNMILTCDNEETQDTQFVTRYFISVIGDTNANGEIEQLELSQLIRYLVDKTNNNLSLLPFLSMDINMDGKLDIIDITLMIRYITYDEIELEPEKLPSKPIIEITQENKGIENWYNSDVTLKVETDSSSLVEILKNTYEITGKINQREKDIAKEELITLTEEGAYEVTAYSYSVYGTKSDKTLKEIKIDKQAPTIGKIEVQGEEGNTGAIVVSELDDTLSGLYQISICQNAVEYEWETLTNDNFIDEIFTKEITKNGTWYVSVKDKAGNIKTQSTQVTNIKEKVSNIEIKLQDIIGIEETLPIDIKYLGEAKSVQVQIESEELLSLDESGNLSEDIKDESENIVGKHLVYKMKGIGEGIVELRIEIEDYDGAITTKSYNIIVVDKQKSVALVERMYYRSITEAIESIDKEGTLTILKDVEENFSIPENKTITLKVGTYTITGRINNKGNLILESGKIQNEDETIYNTGTVLMQNGIVTSNKIAMHNLANAQMTIENGEIASQGNYAILNYGNLLIENANVKTESENLEAISNEAEATLKMLNGKVEALKTTAIKNKGNLTIGKENDPVDVTSPVIIGKDFGIYTAEGTFNWFDGNITARQILFGEPTKLAEGYLINREVKNDIQIGTLVTPKYSVNNNNYILLSEAIEAVREGGTINVLQDVQDVSEVEITKKVILNLNEFTITRNKEIAVKEHGDLTVKEGTIQSDNSTTITVYMGKLQVENANIIGNNSAIEQRTQSTTHIISGKVQGNVYGIKSTTQGNTIILGDSSSAIKLSNPDIIGEEYGIYAEEGTQICYYSGKIEGKQEPGYYTIQKPTYREGYITTVTVENEYYVSTLISNSKYQVYARRESSIEYYKSIKEAIDYAVAQNVNTTINFMRNITENIIIPKEANITLEMGEYTLNGNIANEGTLTIGSGKITNGESTLIYNSNILNIVEGTIEDLSEYSPAIYNKQGAKTVITGGKITSNKNSAIVNCGTLEVTHGEIVSLSQNNSGIVTENNGSTTIKGGSVKASTSIAMLGKENSVITLGNAKDENVLTELPLISGKQYGIKTEGRIIFNDGKVDGNTAIEAQEVQALNGYSVYVKNYDTYQEAVIIPLTDSVRIGENVYSTLEAAITAVKAMQATQQSTSRVQNLITQSTSKAQNQVTIEILRDIEESVTIPENTNIILDIGNYTITGRTKNRGTLNIISGTLENDENGAIYNEGILTISKGTIRGTKTSSQTVFNASKGTMTITGGEIFSQNSNSIDNRGYLTITNTAYIHNNSSKSPTILNQAGANLTVLGGRITNHSKGQAISGEGTKSITGGIIEPEN